MFFLSYSQTFPLTKHNCFLEEIIEITIPQRDPHCAMETETLKYNGVMTYYFKCPCVPLSMFHIFKVEFSTCTIHAAFPNNHYFYQNQFIKHIIVKCIIQREKFLNH